MRTESVVEAAGRIRLHRQVDPRPVALFEGEPDRLVFERTVSRQGATCFVLGPRYLVLEVASTLHEWGLDRAVCIVDRDFDDVVAQFEVRGVPIAAYDGGDLEHMLWESSALDDLLEQAGNRRKVQSEGGVNRVREMIAPCVATLAAIRVANAEGEWGLNFRNLNLARLIDQATLTIKRQALCDAVHHAGAHVKKRDVYEAADAGRLKPCPQTGEPRIRGKDAVGVLSAALRRRIGSATAQQSAPDRLAEMLRLAATSDAVAKTVWRQTIRDLIGL